MPIKIGESIIPREPTTLNIIEDGTQKPVHIVTVTKNGATEPIWSQSTFIFFENATNTTITVTRLDSPYAHASLGTVGHYEKVYYGDVLQVDATVTGNYKLDKLSWREQHLDFNYINSGDTFTVGATKKLIIIQAVSSENQSWKTVWTGTYQFGSGLDGGSEVNATMNFILPSTGPTRIQCYGEAVWKDGDEFEYGPTLTLTLPDTFTMYGSQDGGITGQFSVINNQINFNGAEYGDSGYSGGAVYVTKIEQYY